MRDCFAPNRLRWATLVIFLGPIISACGGFGSDLEYVVRAANYTNQGIILVDFPLLDTGEKRRERWGIFPGVPGVADDIQYLGPFADYPHSLPEQMSVTWQVAKLTDCDDVRRSETRLENDPDPKVYTFKLGCTWTPLEGQVFTRELDMDAIRNSEAYRVAANPPPGSFLRGQPTLRIDLIFHDSGLEVRTSRGRLLGFMQ